jgi:transcriptional regulator with XRE-family HTH domain
VTSSVFTHQYALLRQLLINARQRHGLSQSELARRLGKPQSFVSKYERGERRLDLVEFLEVAAALEENPRNLLEELLNGTS